MVAGRWSRCNSLDGAGRVLYIGSLSKVLLPTFRLGFAVVPTPLHAAMRKPKHLTDWHSPLPLQAAAAQFIDDGLLAQHIRRMRRSDAARHERLMRTLAHELTGVLTPVPSRCGLHIAATFDDPAVDDRAVAACAAARGVSVLPLSPHFVDRPPVPGLILGYGAIATSTIDEAVRRVRGCVAAQRSG